MESIKRINYTGFEHTKHSLWVKYKITWFYSKPMLSPLSSLIEKGVSVRHLCVVACSWRACSDCVYLTFWELPPDQSPTAFYRFNSCSASDFVYFHFPQGTAVSCGLQLACFALSCAQMNPTPAAAALLVGGDFQGPFAPFPVSVPGYSFWRVWGHELHISSGRAFMVWFSSSTSSIGFVLSEVNKQTNNNKSPQGNVAINSYREGKIYLSYLYTEIRLGSDRLIVYKRKLCKSHEFIIF